MRLNKEKVLPIIMNALTEDVAGGDITSQLVFERDVNVIAEVIVNERCVVAGIDIARWVFNALDEKIIFKPLCKDGDALKKGKGKRIVSVRGSAKNILSGERTALNFLGRASGIATLTSRFVEKVKGTGAKIYDTRKTAPGLRELEKYAVRIGGGYNHRMGLWDGVLIKDNHLDSLRSRFRGSKPSVIKELVRRAKARGYKNIEIEVDGLKGYREALEAGADIIMLDNMKLEDIRRAAKIQTSRPILEVSGGITLKNVAQIARTGVDRISIGALTHSAPSVDFSLEIC